ncbi:hypothetical protein JNM05_11890 [bacterium]|nr:hypothetical protein [bacterium]
MASGIHNTNDRIFYKSSRSWHRIYFIVLFVYAYGNFLVEIVPPLTQAVSIVRAVADFLLLLFGVKALVYRENKVLRLLVVFFVIISSVTFYLNSSTTTLFVHLNGLREPLVLIVALAMLAHIFYSDGRGRFVRSMNKFLLVFLVIQIPVAFSQFFRFGAGDQVGGTFSDGGSGMLSQIIFLAVYYLLLVRAGKPNGVGFRLNKVTPLLILFIPVFINQTKISFVFFAVLALLQVRVQLNLAKVFFTIAAGAVALFLFVKILAATTDIDLADYLDPDTIEKDFFSDWAAAEDITRFGKLVIAYDQFENEPYKHIWGAGYGLMKGKSVIETSEAGRDLERLYFGSRIQFFSTYLQGGLLFTALFLILNFYYFTSSRNTHFKYNFIRFKSFAFSLFVLMWIYNDALLVTYFNLFAAYFLVFIKHGDMSLTSSMLPRSRS